MSTAADFIITAGGGRTPVRKLTMYKGEVRTITIDYSPWEEDNGTVTAAALTVESGDAAAGNEALASSTKTFTVTTANSGWSMFKILATAGNNKHAFYLQIYAQDPDTVADDYGFIAQ